MNPAVRDAESLYVFRVIVAPFGIGRGSVSVSRIEIQTAAYRGVAVMKSVKLCVKVDGIGCSGGKSVMGSYV